jgi:uncharacterized protein (TIGR02145 family)
MKITYFDPNSSTVTLNGYTYNYYPNGFTSTNCSNMTPSNTTTMNPISPGPNPSIVYVRDTRNNQVYKVKRMIDNKCWMIDNLKYSGPTTSSGTTINNVDGTTGIIFRNGSGPNNPSSGTDTYNTVDGNNTQSAANSDKAFYNNPMSNTDCYGGSTSYMAANTTTHCGYLYNWYAATAGTGTYSMGTSGNQASSNICPDNFRLPSSTSGTGGPTTNGTVATAADIPVLNASMNANALTAGATGNFYANWQPSGAWSGTMSGHWTYSARNQGISSYFSLSTVGQSNLYVSVLYYTNMMVVTNYNNLLNKAVGNAIRCVMP